MFLHCIGTEALKVFNTFNLPDDDTTKLTDIIKKFEDYIIGETNETYERYKFNGRNQMEDETTDEYVTALKTLAETCNFCDCMKESLIRDRLLTGLKSTETRKKLLEQRKLTLKSAVDICRAMESSSTQLKAMAGANMSPVDSVSKLERRESQKSRPAGRSDEQRRQGNMCKFCGTKHEFLKSKCPAWGRTCSNCHGKNHFAKVCRNKNRVRAVDEDSNSSEDEWVNTMKEQHSKSVKCKMLLSGKPVVFLIDTGATINLLPERFATHLVSTTKLVRSYTDSAIPTKGTSRQTIANPKNGKKYSVEFVVVENNSQPIIGLKAARQMRLIGINEENFERAFSILQDQAFAEGIGTFPGKQYLTVDPSVPPVIMPDRRVPIALKPKLKAELEDMTKKGIITPVTEPTPWVSQLVVVTKPNGKLRVCIDPKYLNRALQRERFTMPVLDDVLHELSQSTVFTKVDLRNGYWHIQLDEQSSLLTTFQTCFGRYRFLRLPFGLNVSAEIFERKVRELFMNMPGVVCLRDDIIIHGSTMEDHNEHLKYFLDKCELHGVRLNKEKLELRKDSISFMGHIISKEGISTDPKKVKAITNLPTPKNTKDVRRVLGMIQYLARFVPNLTNIVHPLQNLLKKDVPFVWSQSQEKAFGEMKNALSKSPTLGLYDSEKELTLENDASEYGIGSVLLQDGKPLAYASRSLTSSEQNYAQIEKELLAITYGLKKFHHFTYGRPTTVITDHKPLVSIHQKPLCKAPKRLQSLLLKTQEYNYNLLYRPGKDLAISDCLSRAPMPQTDEDEEEEEEEEINNLQYTPFKENRLQEIKAATMMDAVLSQLKLTILQGWPDNKSEVPVTVLPFFNYRDELTVQDGIILRGDRVVIPQSMRKDMKQKVHAGHQGINSCLRRARDLIFWPGMSTDIRNYIESCDTCATYSTKQPEQPLQSHEIPSLPWQKVGTDMFTIQGRNYLVTVDYFSQYIEVDHLPETTSTAVITKLKHHFARYGIPNVVISDNGPQFSSTEFHQFSEKWSFKHSRIAPGNSRANGQAESAVKIIKNMMKKCRKSGDDPYIGLLNIRNTPSEGLATSPVQRLMGRSTQTLLPTTPGILQPSRIPVSEHSKLHLKRFISAQRNCSQRPLPPLQPGNNVRMEPIDGKGKEWRQATVTKSLPRNNYEVWDGKRTFIRARRFLRRIQPETPAEDEDWTPVILAPPHMPTTRVQTPHSRTPHTSSCNQPQQAPDMDNVRDTDRPASRESPRNGEHVSTPVKTRSGRVVKAPIKLNL